ncbi:hypothetical protein D915_002246, partial [Fasciola hepatica]
TIDFLSLSDSDEEVDEQASFAAKRSRKCRGRARDPDPTWCASSCSSKKVGPARLLSPTILEGCLPTSSLTGGSLHPLLKNASSNPSGPSVESDSAGSAGPKSPGSTKQSKNKLSTTVRQRLAKRLGLS